MNSLEIGPLGPQYDRRWMVVDARGMFVAQRGSKGIGVAIPEMCLIRVAFRGEWIVFNAPSMPELMLLKEGVPLGARAEVQVWDRQPSAVDQGALASLWFTEYLSQFKPGTYRLVRMPDGDGGLSFADGFSLLVISQASLDYLNWKIAERRRAAGLPAIEPLDWDRLRPTMVFTGCNPHDEDWFLRMYAGEVRLGGKTLCPRCPVPAINQQTAVLGKEPLATLATYRRLLPPPDKRVVFGRNCTHLNHGTIFVGDPVALY